MKVLALDPYYGGSHKALVDGWAARGELWQGDPRRAIRALRRFDWERRAPAMDEKLRTIAPTV